MIIDWLEENIDEKIIHTGSGKEVHFNCVNCDDTRHRMYVNLSTGKVYCHNCGYSSDLTGLIQLVTGENYGKSLLILKDIQGNTFLPENVNEHLLSRMFIGSIEPVKRGISLPDEYIPLNPYKTNLSTKRAIRYLHSRGITDKQIVKHNFGFCIDGDYKNRIIIPIYMNEELRFWVARATNSVEKLKEKSPHNEDYQISKSEVIFNLDNAVRLNQSIVISEGIFDALSWGSIGISLLGKSLYKEQLNHILDYKDKITQGVYIALDYDAKKEAVNIAKQLSEYFDTFIVKIPKHLDDPNNCLQVMGRPYLYQLLEQSEKYSEFTSLYSKFL